MLLDDIAKELVAYTSDLVGGRTINIMNTEGIIIASTDENRIGSFHQGALDAVQTGKPVAVEPDETGTKQGYNMPICIEGDIVGVIGIFGDSSEIKPLAQLLEVFAVKYYQLESVMVPRMAEMEQRSRLLRNILYPTTTSIRNARMLMQELRFTVDFPVMLAVLAPAGQSHDPSWAANLSHALQEKKVISPQTDLWGIENNSMVILARGTDFTDRILKSGLLSPEGNYTVSIGDVCEDFRDIGRAFEQAVTLQEMSPEPYSNITDPGNRCRCEIRHISEREADHIVPYMNTLEEACTEEELKILLQSAMVYYDESHSVSRASQILFIHKNTLQYRMKKLESLLNISDWPEFRKEFMVRVLIEYYLSKKGQKTLM